MYLDPYSATRIGSQEQTLGSSTKAMALEAKDDPRSNEDDPSWLEMGHINVDHRWEVNTEQ